MKPWRQIICEMGIDPNTLSPAVHAHLDRIHNLEGFDYLGIHNIDGTIVMDDNYSYDL